jgi:Xaa-Pro aminopeptidase
MPGRRVIRPIISSIILLFSPAPTATPGLLSAAGAAGDAKVSAPPDSAVPVELLAGRRAALLATLEPGIALVRSADRRSFHEHPQDSDFRQDNNFYYLTGIEAPGSWLVLFKPERGPGKLLLYVPERDPAREVWTGAQLGPGSEVAELTGIEAVRPASEFQADILNRLGQPEAFREYPRIYLPLGEGVESTGQVVELAVQARRSISDLGKPLAELRLVKDTLELARLRRAVAITAEAQREAMKAARPGMYEYELEAVVEYVFRSRGAERVGFPSIVGSGPNSVILHYDRNRRRMEESDLVVIDIGAEYGYYSADLTRTLPVGGKFRPRQRRIYELVLATQAAVIDSVRPGMTFWELERIARSYMRVHSKGLCGGNGCDRYFRHGLGHWLGMDVHDVGSYATPFAPGMVLTIEPGIYLADEGLGVRIEDDVLVTEDGHEVLSADAPRSVAEIEALMCQAAEPSGRR